MAILSQGEMDLGIKRLTLKAFDFFLLWWYLLNDRSICSRRILKILPLSLKGCSVITESSGDSVIWV